MSVMKNFWPDVSKEQHKIQMKVSTVLSGPDVQNINSMEQDQYNFAAASAVNLHLMEVQKDKFNSKTALVHEFLVVQ